MLKTISRLVSEKENLVKLGIAITFFFLLIKDPFSERTLIPNFEPHPDTFYYLNPALNLVKGTGFNISREGRSVVPNVPPLYSLVLAPVFIIRPDPRMAYYVNIILAFISLIFFYKISKKLFPNKLILYFVLILYTTNYFIYWVPTIIMAENLSLTLFLASLFFLLSKISYVNLMITAALSVGIYGTKYASLPISVSLVFLCFFRILLVKYTTVEKIKFSFTFFITLILCYLPLAFFEQITKGGNVISQALSILIRSNNQVAQNTTQFQASSNPWFGVQYIMKNLPLYINSLLGNPNRFLWDNTPLVPKFVAIGGILGILGGFFNKRFIFICIGLVTFLTTSVIFMSTFYTFDARYIQIAIPILLIGFGLLITIFEKFFFSFNRRYLNYLFLLAIGAYLFTNVFRIKSQISLNLRYAETPWRYIAVLKTNEYFTQDKIIGGKKPILISAMPPYLVDFYSNGNYTLLPLSSEQEFRHFKELVWGPNDYSDLPKLYTKYINEGFDLYVSRAGLDNESYTNRDFNVIVEKFDVNIVYPGCFEQCNIYSVKLKHDFYEK